MSTPAIRVVSFNVPVLPNQDKESEQIREKAQIEKIVQTINDPLQPDIILIRDISQTALTQLSNQLRQAANEAYVSTVARDLDSNGIDLSRGVAVLYRARRFSCLSVKKSYEQSTDGMPAFGKGALILDLMDAQSSRHRTYRVGCFNFCGEELQSANAHLLSLSQRMNKSCEEIYGFILGGDPGAHDTSLDFGPLEQDGYKCVERQKTNYLFFKTASLGGLAELRPLEQVDDSAPIAANSWNTQDTSNDLPVDLYETKEDIGNDSTFHETKRGRASQRRATAPIKKPLASSQKTLLACTLALAALAISARWYLTRQEAAVNAPEIQRTTSPEIASIPNVTQKSDLG